MAKLPVVEDEERKVIRARLKAYQKTHGNIGVPTLQQRMLFVLDLPEHQYVDLKSLQRFLSGKGRTTDEKVIRYRKFLDKDDPSSDRGQFVTKLGRALLSRRLVPEYVSQGDEIREINGEKYIVPIDPVPFDDYYWRRPLIDYIGRYEIEIRPMDAANDVGTLEAERKRLLLLLPTPEERVLRAINLVPMYPDAPTDAGAFYQAEMFEALFMKVGHRQFVLMNAGHADVSMTLLDEVGDDAEGAPIVLSGTMLHTGTPESGESGLVRMTLTQIAGPNLVPLEEET